MARKDYYAVLGVARDASTRQLKDRFRALARERHPDRFQGAEKRAAEDGFQAITEAYNLLVDPVRRRQHDEELDRPAQEPRHDPLQAARVYLARGVKAYQAQAFLEAASNFQRAVEIDSHLVAAWYHLARTAIEEKRWLGKAREAIERALELEPERAAFATLAGQIYQKSGMIEKARGQFRRALRLGADNKATREALESLEAGRHPREAKPAPAAKKGRFQGLFRKKR